MAGVGSRRNLRSPVDPDVDRDLGLQGSHNQTHLPCSHNPLVRHTPKKHIDMFYKIELRGEAQVKILLKVSYLIKFDAEGEVRA